MRILQQPNRITMWINDDQEPIINQRLSAELQPRLRLYGLGREGSTIHFDDLKIRVPPRTDSDAP